MSDPQTTFDQIVGRSVLFIGNECQNWSLANFAAAGRIARSLGFDTICPKRANGTQRWYAANGLGNEYKAVHDAGCGFLPFTYSYGPQYGLGFVREEAQVMAEMGDMIAQARGGQGFIISDMEAEWNGRIDAANVLRDELSSNTSLLDNLFGITTWADPDLQGWQGIIQVLKPWVNAWIPQEYNSWLAVQDLAGMINVHPAIDLSQEFGYNNQLQIIQNARSQGRDNGFFFWDYSLAFRDVNFTRRLNGAVRGG